MMVNNNLIYSFFERENIYIIKSITKWISEIYFILKTVLGEWMELPLVTPQQVVAAR